MHGQHNAISRMMRIPPRNQGLGGQGHFGQPGRGFPDGGRIGGRLGGGWDSNRPVPAPQGGYQGLDHVMEMLNGGINQSQFDKLNQGYTGANGSIGGMQGAMAGLSPAAVHWLASSGMLQKQAAPQTATEGLTGDSLFAAQMMNQLQGAQPATYKLHSGIDQAQLGQMLGLTQGGGFAQGYNADGKVGPPPREFVPPGLQGNPGRRIHPGNPHDIHPGQPADIRRGPGQNYDLHDVHQGRPTRRRGGRRAFIGETR